MAEFDLAEKGVTFQSRELRLFISVFQSDLSKRILYCLILMRLFVIYIFSVFMTGNFSDSILVFI